MRNNKKDEKTKKAIESSSDPEKSNKKPKVVNLDLNMENNN